jgi:dTDP-4-dehydrorhamnose 3,5-epimerase
MESLSIDGAWVYTPRIFPDDRGLLTEAYQLAEFTAATGYPVSLRQVNCSVSRRGVIRGIHFTAGLPGQAKYVFCPAGVLLDVVVDIRVGSPTFGRWEAVRLDDSGRRATFLEHGLGHALMALSPEATAVYLCTSTYDRAADRAIHPLDPQIGIDWPRDAPFILSGKDTSALSLAQMAETGALPHYSECMRYREELRAGLSAAAIFPNARFSESRQPGSGGSPARSEAPLPRTL